MFYILWYNQSAHVLYLYQPCGLEFAVLQLLLLFYSFYLIYLSNAKYYEIIS